MKPEITPPASSFLIGPHESQSAIYRLRDGGLSPLATLSYPALSRSVMDQSGWFSCIVRRGRRISIGRFTEGGAVEYEGTIEMPRGAYAQCLAINGRTLYVGSKGKDHIIGMIRLDAPHLSWEPMARPEEAHRKAVDELLLDEDRLFSVDNLVTPMWLWEYDVTEPASPKLVRSVKLPHHGPYEHVVAAAVGKHWIAIISKTGGRQWAGKYLALYSKETLEQCCVLEWYGISQLILSAPDKNGLPIQLDSLAFLGDRLFMPAGTKGIGYLDVGSGLESGELEAHVAFHNQEDLAGQNIIRVSSSPKKTGLLVCNETVREGEPSFVFSFEIV